MPEEKPSPSPENPGTAIAPPKDHTAIIDKIIENKQKSAAYDWENAINYGLGVGLTTYMAQMMTPLVTKSMYINSILQNPETRKAYEALGDTEKNSMVFELMEKNIQNSSGIKRYAAQMSKSIVKNPMAWNIGMTAAGIGMVLGWEWWKSQGRAAEAAQEIADLKTIKQSWAERVSEPAKGDPTAGLQK